MKKNKIWELIARFILGEVNEVNFCNQFYDLYVHQVDYNEYSPEEELCLNQLSEVAGRFTQFETDLRDYPGVFYTKEELAAKICETKDKLVKIHPEYFS